jgi:hypothetical protein
MCCAKGNISTHKDGKHSGKPYEKQMFPKFGWSRGLLEIHQSDEKNTEISQTTTFSSPIRPYSPKLPRNRKKEVKKWVDF